MKLRCEGISSLILAGILYTGCLIPAAAQNPTCPTRPFGTSDNSCASTAFVQAAIAGIVNLPNHSVVLGTGTNALSSVGPGSSGAAFLANGASADPTWTLTPTWLGTHTFSATPFALTTPAPYGRILVGSATGSAALGNPHIQVGPNWTASAPYNQLPTGDYCVSALCVYGDSSHTQQGIQTVTTTESISGAGISLASYAYANNASARGAWPIYTEGHVLQANDYSYGLGEAAAVNRSGAPQPVTPYGVVGSGVGIGGLQLDCGNGVDSTTYVLYSCSYGLMIITNNGSGQSTTNKGFANGIVFIDNSLDSSIYNPPHAIAMAGNTSKHAIVWFATNSTVPWKIYSDASSGTNELVLSNSYANFATQSLYQTAANSTDSTLFLGFGATGNRQTSINFCASTSCTAGGDDAQIYREAGAAGRLLISNKRGGGVVLIGDSSGGGLQVGAGATGVAFNQYGAGALQTNASGVISAGVVTGANGGTGVANTGKTITLGGNLTTSGAFDVTFTLTGATNVTLPTSGTLATTAGASIPTVAQGDLLYGSAANTLSALTKDTNATRYLANTGTSNNPAWAQVNLANGVTGTLPVGNGGTGATTFTSNGVLYGNTTGAVQVTAQGPANSVLTANAGAPAFSATPTLNSFTLSSAGSAPTIQCFASTCAFIWFSTIGSTTGQRIGFGSDASVNDIFRIYGATLGGNIMTLNAGTGQVIVQQNIASTASNNGSLVNNGGFGNAGAGWFGTYIATGVVGVGSLPSCGAGIKGARMFVNDSNAASYTAGIGAVVAAGGSTNVPVICDGTNWRIGQAPANDNYHQLRKVA